ncbi:hypothetical protein GCM10023085_59490 [Actinomadura viridis]|uniref:Uncharacterized protein n=1 Tax=Actinomadura viridis TaxID=58110 RepID=A0A931GN11_9ACTN|nr:hypothetical protein [Actinomadura viridis]MBG6093257.1 hypothetical protein [Actinomadura viridis]
MGGYSQDADTSYKCTCNTCLKNYSPQEVEQLYQQHKADGTLDDHPELRHQYTITSTQNAPDLAGYQGQKRENDPSRQWGKNAEDGFEVDPDELRALRTTIINDLNDLTDRLRGVKGLKGFSVEKVGGGEVGQQWVNMATNASTVFGEYFDDILANIEGVAAKLKATYESYEGGENRTQQQVEGGVDI